MNIFELREKSIKDVEDKAKTFVLKAYAAIKEINPASNMIKDFITGYRGWSATAYPYEKHNSIPNPNYKPGLSPEEYKKPENREIDAGFSYITIDEKMVSISAKENEDPYDDCQSPDSWHIDVPFELFLNGTESEIYSHFYDKFKERALIEKRNQFDEKYNSLMYLSNDEINQYLELRKQNPPLTYSDHDKILDKLYENS